MGVKSTKNKSGGRLLQFLRSNLRLVAASNSAKRASEYVPLTATGGNTVTTVGKYKSHIFTSPGTFSVDPAAPLGDFGATIEYLVIAGGGGTGSAAMSGTSCPGQSGTSNRGSGGGGAGGVRTNSPSFNPTVSNNTPFPVSAGSSYAITVGGGGAVRTQGTPSVFNTGGVEGTTKFTATGGGVGGDGGGNNGTAGGSGGGGGGGCGPGGAGNNPPTSPAQGNPGESGGPHPGGNGGSVLPTGGVTTDIFTGSSVVYARGGNGNSYGGVGSAPPTTYADGGGAYGNATPGTGIGANGVVIVRYQVSA